MGIYKRGDIYWYRFNWHGEQIRESTKQGNARVAGQIEAAHKTALAKGEVGIRERVSTPTLKQFAEHDFLPYIEARFTDKPNTIAYYKFGVKRLADFDTLADTHLDSISPKHITAFVEQRRGEGLEVSSINRQLEVLRRMFKLAAEWGKVEKALPRVSMLPGEKRRERVLTGDEEALYFAAANSIGDGILETYNRALKGIRAAQRGEEPIKPTDPYLLRDIATILIECALRPEEAYRLRWEQIRDGSLWISHGKTENARRVIPIPQRATAVLEMRRTMGDGSGWVFPAPTASGHVEQSSIKKGHTKACELGGVEYFPPYTLRHTCLTRWAEVMDPYTLAYLAGHSDFSTTRRYVHPRRETVLSAINRVEITRTVGTNRAQRPAGMPNAPSVKLVQSIEAIQENWRARRDSNPRPIGSKPICITELPIWNQRLSCRYWSTAGQLSAVRCSQQSRASGRNRNVCNDRASQTSRAPLAPAGHESLRLAS
jgi:integrase